MRGRMNDVKSYVPPFQLDQPMDGGAVGEVVASRRRAASRSATTCCTGSAGASTRCSTPGTPPSSTRGLAPLSAYLGVLGMPGLTAYAGLLRIAAFKEGDDGLRLRRGRRGRQPGRPDRQAQGRRAGDRLGRLRREGQAPDGGVRLRRRLQLQERARGRAAAGRPPPTASTSTSTTSAATTSKPPSARCTTHGRVAHLRHDRARTTRPNRRPVRATSPWSSASDCSLRGPPGQRPHGPAARSSSREVGGWLRDGRAAATTRPSSTASSNGVDAFLGLLRGDNTGKMIVSLQRQRWAATRPRTRHRRHGRDASRLPGGSRHVHSIRRRPVHRGRHGGERP